LRAAFSNLKNIYIYITSLYKSPATLIYCWERGVSHNISSAPVRQMGFHFL